MQNTPDAPTPLILVRRQQTLPTKLRTQKSAYSPLHRRIKINHRRLPANFFKPPPKATNSASMPLIPQPPPVPPPPSNFLNMGSSQNLKMTSYFRAFRHQSQSLDGKTREHHSEQRTRISNPKKSLRLSPPKVTAPMEATFSKQFFSQMQGESEAKVSKSPPTGRARYTTEQELQAPIQIKQQLFNKISARQDKDSLKRPRNALPLLRPNRHKL